jgi:hypothetical protein
MFSAFDGYIFLRSKQSIVSIMRNYKIKRFCEVLYALAWVVYAKNTAQIDLFLLISQSKTTA